MLQNGFDLNERTIVSIKVLMTHYPLPFGISQPVYLAPPKFQLKENAKTQNSYTSLQQLQLIRIMPSLINGIYGLSYHRLTNTVTDACLCEAKLLRQADSHIKHVLISLYERFFVFRGRRQHFYKTPDVPRSIVAIMCNHNLWP